MNRKPKTTKEQPNKKLLNEATLVAELCEAKFYEYVKEAWNHIETVPFVDNWHIGCICEHLEAVTRGDIQKLIINIPPGCSKSLLAAVLWPTWEWTVNPSVRWIFSSYQIQLALRDSVKCRTLIQGNWYQELWGYKVQLADDQNQKTQYTTTAGGYRMATTVQGYGTGEHPDRIVIDDAHSAVEAESDTERQNVLDWYDLQMSSRGVARDARRVIIGQRLNENDLPGHLMRKEGWETLIIPMRYEEGRTLYSLPEDKKPHELRVEIRDCVVATVLQRQNPELRDPRTVDGELLTPRLFPEAKVRELENNLLEYGTAGQLQQRPRPRSGGMFKLTYFNNTARSAPYEMKRVRFWDRAATQDDGCYTAGVLIGKDKDNKYWVEHCVHGQWNPDERNKIILATAKADRRRYGPKFEPVINIERELGASGKEAFQYLARLLAGFRVREWSPTGNKDVRAEPWADQLAAGNVWFVDHGWDFKGYVDEHLNFKPDKGKRGKYKDQVDASAAGFSILCNVRTYDLLRARPLRELNKKREGKLQVITCSPTNLGEIELQTNCILIFAHEPCSAELPMLEFSPSLQVDDTLELGFADIAPEEVQDRWKEPMEPYGQLPEELVLTPEQGKLLWSFLLRNRQKPPGAIIFCGDGRKPLSMANGFCEALRLPREQTILCFSGEPVSPESGKPEENKHVFEIVKRTRARVV